MAYRIDGTHVRIRTTLKRDWVWELITRDGHVAFVSEPYADRDPCERDAHAQGLPTVGGRKQPRQRAKPRSAGLRVFSSGRGLWRWEYLNDQGEVVASSQLAFLSREECERDFVGDARHVSPLSPPTPLRLSPTSRSQI